MRVRTLAAAMLVAAASAHVAAETPVERGRYLVNTILACGNCHTPKDAEGRPLEARELAGGGLSFDLPFFAGTASNITPDRETGIGSWTDEEIARAITRGVRPAHGRLPGTELAVVMWVNFYKALLPSDLAAVVAYLRSIPPVRNPVAQPVYRKPVRRETYPEAERGFTEADLRDPVRRGAYLATIGHCMECHTPTVQGRTLYGEALGKGRQGLPAELRQGLSGGLAGQHLAQHHVPCRRRPGRLDRHRDCPGDHPRRLARRPRARATDGLPLVRRPECRGRRRARCLAADGAGSRLIFQAIFGGAGRVIVCRNSTQNVLYRPCKQTLEQIFIATKSPIRPTPSNSSWS